MLDAEITTLTTAIAQQLDGNAGYAAIQELPGIGPVLAAVIVAEIGDVRRFAKPGKLCSWAGLTPRHRESDTRVRRGHITSRALGSCGGRCARRSSTSPTGSARRS